MAESNEAHLTAKSVISVIGAAILGAGGGTFGTSQWFQEHIGAMQARLVEVDGIRQAEAHACRKSYENLVDLYRAEVNAEWARCREFLGEARSACLASIAEERKEMAALVASYETVSGQLSACLTALGGRSESSVR